MGTKPLISWTEQNTLFGLDYSTKVGKYKDFKFDIRYDYDGDPKNNPNCGIFMLVYFNGVRLREYWSGRISDLTESAEEYLRLFLAKYQDGMYAEKELTGIAVDFAYYLHVSKQSDCSSEKQKELFFEWINQYKK